MTILLLAPESAGQLASQALRHALDAEVDLQTSLLAGAAALRTREYALILLDETLVLDNQEAIEYLYEIQNAPVLELNFALSSSPRIVRQARAALVRRTRDLALAHIAVTSRLHSDLNQTLSGLLLESELALSQAAPEQQARLREVVQMAANLRDQLRPQTQPMRP